MPKTLRVVCDAGEAIRYIIIFKNLLFIHVFLSGLGLCCCTHGVFLVLVSGGYALVVADKLLIGVTSLVAEHRL